MTKLVRPETTKETHDKVCEYANRHGLKLWKVYELAVDLLIKKEEKWQIIYGKKEMILHGMQSKQL